MQDDDRRRDDCGVIPVRYGVVNCNDIKGRVIYDDRWPELEKVGFRNWTWKRVDGNVSRKAAFQSALEASIAKEGLRNPILCFAFDSGLYAAMGINRLRAAKRLGVDVPVIINDHSGDYKEFELLTSESEVRSKFTDQPEDVRLEDDIGVRYSYCQTRRSMGPAGPFTGNEGFTVRYVDRAPVDEARWKLIRNPSYSGNKTSHPKGYVTIPFPGYNEKAHLKQGFHDALEADIRENGVRNPVILIQVDQYLCVYFGGSRVRVCQHMDLDTIPAIITDYSGRWSAHPEVTPDNYEQFFTDVPAVFQFNNEGVETTYNLEKRNRHKWDNASFDWLEGEEPDWLKEDFAWLYQST